MYTTDILNEKSECGKVSKNYFSLNSQHIDEALHHNTCIHKKLFMDKNDIYSQQANCHYNLYIAKWQGEDGYITVEKWLENNKIK